MLKNNVISKYRQKERKRIFNRIIVLAVSLFILVAIFKFSCKTRTEEENVLKRVEENLKSIEKNPLNVELYTELGSDYLKLGTLSEEKVGSKVANVEYYDNAIKYFRKAVVLGGKKNIAGKVHYQLGIVYFKKGKEYHKEAISEFTEAIGTGYRNIELMSFLGNIYAQSGDYRKAIECYEKAYDMDKKNTTHVFNLAWAYKQLKEYDKSIELFSRILKMDETKKDMLFITYESLGWLNYSTGNYDESLKYYENLLKISPGYEKTLYWLGKVHKAKKEYAKAADYMNRLLKINPSNSDAKNQLKELARESQIK